MLLALQVTQIANTLNTEFLGDKAVFCGFLSRSASLRFLTTGFFLLAILLLSLTTLAPIRAEAATIHVAPMVRLSGHELPTLSKATIVPSKAHSTEQPLSLTIILNRDDQAGFDRYLHDVYDPK